MPDPAVTLVLAVQTALVVAGLLVLPWHGAPLERAVHSSRHLRRRLRRLADRVTADGEPPATQRRMSRAPTVVARLARAS